MRANVRRMSVANLCIYIKVSATHSSIRTSNSCVKCAARRRRQKTVNVNVLRRSRYGHTRMIIFDA
jgi:hypothetical protein